MSSFDRLSRREFSAGLLTGAAAVSAGPLWASAAEKTSKAFRLRYLLSSAMYGYTDLAKILPEVRKTGAEAIDIWPKVHGNQREQIKRMGTQRFIELLKQNNVRLGTSTSYRLGPFGLQDEMKFAVRVGGRGVVLVTGSKGPRNLTGSALKSAVRAFHEKLKPHVAAAERIGCVIAIENHGSSLIASPDSIRWFGEFTTSDHLGIALAPHHLPQDGKLIGRIAADLGPRVKFFYAQQHGMGSSKKLPKQQELLQMPGRGPLDFTPILAALKKNKYQGYTEIFMHPVPRGIPILGSTTAITTEINRSRRYLDGCLKKI